MSEKDHGDFCETEYGMCEKFMEHREQLKEILMATIFIVLMGLAMTAWELYKSLAGKNVNSYKDFVIFGAGSVIWLFFLWRLWFMIKHNRYNDLKVIRKHFKGLVVLYVSLMLFIDSSENWFTSTITITFITEFILIYLIE